MTGLGIHEVRFRRHVDGKTKIRESGGGGGEAVVIDFNFIASCKMNSVEPYRYLVDVLRRLPDTPHDQLIELLPHRWKLSTALRLYGIR